MIKTNNKHMFTHKFGYTIPLLKWWLDGKCVYGLGRGREEWVCGVREQKVG